MISLRRPLDRDDGCGSVRGERVSMDHFMVKLLTHTHWWKSETVDVEITKQNLLPDKVDLYPMVSLLF